jgi:hypothetical protein
MSVEGDWLFLRAALPDLREYILSNEIYWTLRPPSRSPGGVQIPQLTIGNLLLSQARLSASLLSTHDDEELAEMARLIHAVREEWRANWGQKAAKEHTSRLNLWQQYLRELRGDVRAQVGYYAREVRNRAILRLLGNEIITGITNGVPQSEQEQLTMLDQILRGVTQEGPFVWEPELAQGFPPDGFWFLYLQPGKKS